MLVAAFTLCLVPLKANAQLPEGGLIPMTARDLVSLRDVGPSYPEPRRHFIGLSPDHRKIAFQIRQADPETNRYRLALLVCDLTTAAPPVVIDNGGDVMLERISGYTGPLIETGLPDTLTPLWARDGSAIYFLKRLNGSTRIWRAWSNGRGSEPVTKNDGDVSDFAWSADGQHLIYSVWSHDAQAQAGLDSEALHGFHYDTRFWPMVSAAPSVRLQKQAIVRLDVRTGAVDEPSEEERKQFGPQQEDTLLPAPVSSPNGTTAWVWKNDREGQGLPTGLSVRDNQRKVTQCIAATCTDASALWWSQDGTRVRFIRRDGWGNSETSIYEWRPGGPAPSRLYTTKDLLADCQPLKEKIVCAREQSATPRQIVLLDPVSGVESIAYDPNPAFQKFRLGKVERLEWTNSFGVESFGDLVYPVGYVPGRSYPLIVTQYLSRGFLRGGVGDEFPIQVFANLGYAVLNIQRPKITNPPVHGQTETGVERRLLQGFKDRWSVLSSIETQVKRLIALGVVDPDRVGITGLSDGTSTVQFAAVNSRLFKAGSATGCCWESVQDPVVGPEMARAYHEMGWPRLIDADHDFWKHISLINNAERIPFPLLIQQSDDEFRGALASVTALKEAGKPVSLYVFPNEHHIKWQPAHRLAVYERNIRWFDFWLRGIGKSSEWAEK